MYYIDYTPRPQFDLSLLRGPQLPKGKRFETVEDAKREAERRLTRLDGRISQVHFRSLRDCADGHYQCGLLSCPCCTMHYRKWLSGNTLRLFSQLPQPQFSVVVLLERARNISSLEVKQRKDSLRKHLERHLHEATVVGGLEICREKRSGRWILHSNLTIAGVCEQNIRRLRETLNLNNREFWISETDDFAAWHSYQLKFFSYYRPLVQFGRTRSRAFPMPPRLEAEYLEYLSDRQFSEFLLLRNIRRNGNRLERSVFVSNG